MKRFLILIVLSGIFVISAMAQYVTLQGRQFKDEHGEDFYPVVCNYLVSYLYDRDDLDYFFPTADPSNDGWCYECNSLITCLDQISDNFQKLKEMNFNTIRLFGMQPVYKIISGSTFPVWTIEAIDYKYAIDSSCAPSTNKKNFVLSNPFLTDAVTEAIFIFIDSVLVRAYNAGIKVILLAGGSSGMYSENFPGEYGNYLEALSWHLGNVSPQEAKSALMAYDLFNEPRSSWDYKTYWPNVEEGHTKQDACEHVATWYDIIKQYDSSHLVTFGGTFDDVFEFDPGVLKIDFYSPHFYAEKMPYETNYLQGMLNQAYGKFYWYSKNLPMAYILGETGFRSKHLVDNFIYNQGTNQEQKQFADSTLDKSRDYKASGYSWWNYQDYYWSGDDCYSGLLGLDTTPNTNITQEKLIVDAFKNFDPSHLLGDNEEPALYRDPFNHASYSPNEHIITGWVVDELTSDSIEDVYIKGATFLFNLGLKPIYNWHYTYSNSNGYFQLIPYDFEGICYPNTIEYLMISYPGCNRITRGWADSSVGVQSGLTYYLNRNIWKYIDVVHNKVISGPEYIQFQAFYSMELADIQCLSGSNCDFTARTAISLHPDVDIASGSECHIYCSQTFPVCSEMPPDIYAQKSFACQNGNTPDTKSTTQIELNFISETEEFYIELFPNPAKKILTLEFKGNSPISFPVEVRIYNSLGICLKMFLIDERKYSFDVSSLSPGTYYLNVNSKEDGGIKKIIIQP